MAVAQGPEKDVLFNMRRIFGYQWDTGSQDWISCLKILGIEAPGSLLPYDATDNPQGWRAEQAVDWGSLDTLMSQYAQLLLVIATKLDAIAALDKNILELLREANEASPLEEIPVDLSTRGEML